MYVNKNVNCRSSRCMKMKVHKHVYECACLPVCLSLSVVCVNATQRLLKLQAHLKGMQHLT
jgi:hypothetical protein